MKFRCQSQDLMNALSVATHALSARTTLPILEGILMETGEEGLYLTCSDGSMTIVASLPAMVEAEGRLVLPGRLFGDMIRKLPSGEISFSANEKGLITMRLMGSRTTIASKPADQFPERPPIDAHTFVELPQSLLLDMIQQTSFAIATEDTRKILTGGLLEIRGGEARMVALDGFRLAIRLARVPTDLPELSAVIPGRLLMELAKILEGGDEPARLTFGANQLMVEVKGARMYASLLEGEYIKYRQIIPSGFKSRAIIRREDLAQCVERASLMARETKAKLVKFDLSLAGLVVSSNSELGDAHEELDAQFEGDELSIAFNVKYMMDVLRAVSDEEIAMKFNSGVSPCVICPAEGDDYLYMVLPVRINA
jgi:DNA polymerase-3 subunit beta